MFLNCYMCYVSDEYVNFLRLRNLLYILIVYVEFISVCYLEIVIVYFLVKVYFIGIGFYNKLL